MAHELTCTGPAPLRISDLPLAEGIVDGGGASSTRAGKVSSSSSSLSSSMRSAANPGGEASGGNDDVVDLTMEGSPLDDDPRDNDCDVGDRERRKTREEDPTETSAVAARGGGVVGGDDDDSSSSAEWFSVWTCDVCNVREFTTYEEALEHEKVCTGEGSEELVGGGGSSSGSMGGPQDPAAESSSSRRGSRDDHRDEITLFSPVLKDAADSANFWQLSRYHRLILKSIRLSHSASGGRERGGGAVSFHCLHCSCVFPPPSGDDEDNNSNKKFDDPSLLWTIDRIVEVLPSVVENHILNVCKAVPSERKKLPTAKSLGKKMPFDQFIASFFAENGILDSPGGPGGRTSTVVIPDEEFLRIPG
jgi:hypothetical protein